MSDGTESHDLQGDHRKHAGGEVQKEPADRGDQQEKKKTAAAGDIDGEGESENVEFNDLGGGLAAANLREDRRVEGVEDGILFVAGSASAGRDDLQRTGHHHVDGRHAELIVTGLEGEVQRNVVGADGGGRIDGQRNQDGDPAFEDAVILRAIAQVRGRTVDLRPGGEPGMKREGGDGVGGDRDLGPNGAVEFREPAADGSGSRPEMPTSVDVEHHGHDHVAPGRHRRLGEQDPGGHSISGIIEFGLFATVESEVELSLRPLADHQHGQDQEEGEGIPEGAMGGDRSLHVVTHGSSEAAWGGVFEQSGPRNRVWWSTSR